MFLTETACMGDATFLFYFKKEKLLRARSARNDENDDSGDDEGSESIFQFPHMGWQSRIESSDDSSTMKAMILETMKAASPFSVPP